MLHEEVISLKDYVQKTKRPLTQAGKESGEKRSRNNLDGHRVARANGVWATEEQDRTKFSRGDRRLFWFPGCWFEKSQPWICAIRRTLEREGAGGRESKKLRGERKK